MSRTVHPPVAAGLTAHLSTTVTTATAVTGTSATAGGPGVIGWD
ncbi:hypothetical protein [Streptomyces sp. NPDC056401]